MGIEHKIELIIASTFGGGAMVFFGLKRYLLTRKAQDTATSKIAYAPQGFVELEGYAWPMKYDEIITSISGRSLVYYKIELEKYVKQHKSSSWINIGTFKVDNPFYILDDTGVVTVIPDGFDFKLSKTITSWNKLSVEKRRDICGWMSSSVSSLPPLEPGFFSSSYRCKESYLSMGSPVLAHGHLDLSQSAKKEIFDSRLRFFSDKLKNFVRGGARAKAYLDTNQDGKISEEEARAGLHGAALIALRKDNEPETMTPFFGYLKPHIQHTSFIADCHQHDFVKRNGMGNFSLIFFGGLLIVFGICFALY